MSKTYRQYNHDALKTLGNDLGSTFANVDALKKKGGLLPNLERTRGSMSPYKAHDANFTVIRANRTVKMNLEFFPIKRNYLQGAHGWWQYSFINVWNPHFKRKTIPGHLLLAFVATNGSIFESTGSALAPPTFWIPSGININIVTADPDWVILAHVTTPKGHPFVAAFTIAYRFVRENEKTFEPVQVHGGLAVNGGGAANTAGVWVWEIENGGTPFNVETNTYSDIVNHETVKIGTVKDGTVVGGFVVSLFDRDSAPVASYPKEMQQVPHGNIFSSVRNDISSRLFDGGWSYGGFTDGNQWNVGGPVHNGEYWQTTWTGNDVKVTEITMQTLYPWVLYAPNNPSGVLTLDERQDIYDDNGDFLETIYTGLDYMASGAVNFYVGPTGNYQIGGVDFLGVHTIKGIRYTYLGETAFPPYGDKDSGWNEIVLWYDDPAVGKNVQSNDAQNNPLPYHGVFAGGANTLNPPWMYIQQTAFDRIRAELYNDLVNPSTWSVAGGSVVVPGLTQRLPHIPWPIELGGQYFSSETGGGPPLQETIVDRVRVVTSGEGLNMPTDLYASGVRVFIDSQDISQYVFGKPSGVIDIDNWRWDDIDISQWVRSPGQHKLVVTCDEGEADVDSRFETF